MAHPATAGPPAASPATQADGGCVGRWRIDAGRSSLRVSVKVGRFVTVHVSFPDVTGQVEIAADPTRSQVDVSVATAALTSGSSCMDALLHGAGVVDSARNPSISFVSRALRPGDTAGCWLLDGLLATDHAVLDVTLQMVDPVRQDHPARVEQALLFRATGSLPSGQAVRLLSQPGVEKVLGPTMQLQLMVVAVAM